MIGVVTGEALPAAGQANTKVNQENLPALAEAGFVEMLLSLLADPLVLARPTPRDSQSLIETGLGHPEMISNMPEYPLPGGNAGLSLDHGAQAISNHSAEMAVLQGTEGKDPTVITGPKGQVVLADTVVPGGTAASTVQGTEPIISGRLALSPGVLGSEGVEEKGLLGRLQAKAEKGEHGQRAISARPGKAEVASWEGPKPQVGMNLVSRSEPAFGMRMAATLDSENVPGEILIRHLQAEASGGEVAMAKKNQSLPAPPNGAVGEQVVVWSQNRLDFPQVMTAAPERLLQEVLVYARPESTKARLKLETDGLGEIRANLVWKAGQLDASFQVSHQQAAHFLQQGFGELRDRLASQQVPVGELMVTVEDGQQNHSFQYTHQQGQEVLKQEVGAVTRVGGSYSTAQAGGRTAGPAEELGCRDVNLLV